MQGSIRTNGDIAEKFLLRELLEKYCRGIDRRDLELVRACFHEDAIDDHGSLFRGSRDDYIAFIPTYIDQFSITTHHITNALFDVDGDRAEGESYVLANHVTRGWAPQNIVASGRYVDRFERRDGVWRIIHRTGVADWSTIAGGFDPEGWIGTADRSDPSYSLLKMFV
jgi:hypothetical protein